MKLTTISTGSKGNCYVLTASDGERLILDIGVKRQVFLKALDFNTNGVVGCLITHEHGDHIKGIKEVKDLFYCFASFGTIKSIGIDGLIGINSSFKLGNFKIASFKVDHDASEPLGFIIHHPECGIILYLTDTSTKIPKITGVNHYIIEANYCDEMIDSNEMNEALRERIKQTHFSIENCVEYLNKCNAVPTSINLIHLSDTNADPDKFLNRVQSNYPYSNVTIAKKNNSIPLDLM